MNWISSPDFLDILTDLKKGTIIKNTKIVNRKGGSMGEKKGFFSRLVAGLTKTRDNIVSGIEAIFSGSSSIDDDFYEELEEISVVTKEGNDIILLKDGRFVLEGTEALNEPFN